MAAVFITLQDKADGSVDVHLVAEPTTPTDISVLTSAQKLGAEALNAIHANLHTNDRRIIVASADDLH